MVRERGLEPLQEIPLDPKSSASTSSATLAQGYQSQVLPLGRKGGPPLSVFLILYRSGTYGAWCPGISIAPHVGMPGFCMFLTAGLPLNDETIWSQCQPSSAYFCVFPGLWQVAKCKRYLEGT